MRLKYRGSIGWLIFWTLILWPVALVLVLFNTEVVGKK